MNGPDVDLLRRFVPTPHATVLCHPEGELRIESNDAVYEQYLLEHFSNASPNALLRSIEHLKLIVEHSLPQDGEALTQLDAGCLRTVLRGTNTVLMYDAESRELLIFLAQGVSREELVERLLPAVVITNG
ncbi:MAG TPA: hypothetical protein VFC39_01270 [Acidobacteriaceae bacterium]|nr:hypothetical protein [Acidobacteriaceae bacterium]